MTKIGTLAVRRMRIEDVEAVRAIDDEVYSRPWSVSIWRQELSDPQRHHLVATVAGAVVGQTGALFATDEVHVTTVAVDPGHQGRGVGTLLVLDLLDEASARGFEAVTLEVRSADRRAQRIYTRLGFAPAGLRRRYYSDPVDDAIVMWLTDLTGQNLSDRLDPIRSEVLGGRHG